MSRSKRKDQPWRRVRVRGIRRETPDIRKLGAAVIALAIAKAEKAAREEHEHRRHPQGETPKDAA